MSGSQYLSNNKSTLFSIEDDVDDEAFLRHPQSGNSGYTINSTYNSTSNNLQDMHQKQLEKQREIQDKMVQTSQRSLSLLKNSEEIGASTAEELLRQREQLQRTEKRLDEINTALRFSQKHIQSIKSVFGSFKNYLSGKTGDQQENFQKKGEMSISNSSPRLLDAVEKTRPYAASSSQDHPGLRVRGLGSEPNHSNADLPDSEKLINDNLNDMVTSISRLKGLAQGLGEEIESQNDLVENILVKTDRADITLQRQNKDMTRLLK